MGYRCVLLELAFEANACRPTDKDNCALMCNWNVCLSPVMTSLHVVLKPCGLPVDLGMVNSSFQNAPTTRSIEVCISYFTIPNEIIAYSMTLLRLCPHQNCLLSRDLEQLHQSNCLTVVYWTIRVIGDLHYNLARNYKPFHNFRTWFQVNFFFSIPKNLLSA